MSPSLEALLQHVDWVRSLARRLVADADLADDLAQDVWVRALEREPAPEERPRSWLAGVLRNVARERRRARGRRFAREQRAARPERVPSTAEAVERVSTHRDVVEAVLALDEPYRSTLVLRFFEGLPPRRIARREGVPVSTVKTRLARGLARLREKLDREHGGDGRTWALALLPLAGRPAGSFGPPPVLEALLVNTPVKVALVSAAAVSAVVWFQLQGGAPVEPSPVAASTEPPAELVAPALPGERVEPSSPAAPLAREAVAVAEPEVQEPATESDLLVGRVVDLSNRPVSGVALGGRMSTGVRRDVDGGSALWEEDLATGSEPLAISGRGGRFELAVERFGGRLVSVDDDYETILSPSLGIGNEAEVTVVVARRFGLSGAVVDDTGRSVEGATLAFLMPTDLRSKLELAHPTLLTGWRGTTAADGSFDLDRLPAVEGAWLRVRHPGFLVLDVERERWSDEVLRLVLELPGEESIEGVVLAPNGDPVPGAYVALANRAVETGEDGRFRLGLADLGEATLLRALAAGYLPATLEGLPTEEGPTHWPDFVTLRFTDRSLELSGRVVDADGAAVPDQEVWLKAPETSHEDGWLPVVTESILAGAPSATVRVTADADGRFRFEGLLPRRYGLRAVDPETALVVDSSPIEAGRTDVEIVLPADPYWPEVAGRLVTTGGEPLPDAFLTVRRDAHVALRSDGFGMVFNANGATAKSDEEGRFVLERVPRGDVEIHVYDTRIVHFEHELRPDEDVTDLQLVVRRKAHVQVRLSGSPERADALALLDPTGEAQRLSVDTDDGSTVSFRVAIENGRSPVMAAGEDAAVCVLYLGDEEVERIPVRLTTDGVNAIDL